MHQCYMNKYMQQYRACYSRAKEVSAATALFESRKTPLLYVRHPSIFRTGRKQQSWKSDSSNGMNSQQVNVEKKVISKKQITHSHPGSVTVA